MNMALVDINSFNAKTGGPMALEHAEAFEAILELSNAYGGGTAAPRRYRMDWTKKRLDAKLAEAPAELKSRMDSAISKMKDRAKAKARKDGKRADAFDVSSGLFLSRQLEHIYAEVLREPFPAQNGFELFGIDSTVPPGVDSHKVRRLYQNGEAAVYRGGNDGIPRVGLTQREQEFPVRHYVTSFQIDLFEKLAASFAQTNGFPVSLVSELLRVARDVIMEFANQKIWYGDVINGIYGVLNYPWISKKVVATPFTDAADPDLMLAELNALADFPHQNSKQVLSPDTMATSPRVRALLFRRRFGEGSDMTVGKFFLENSSHINSIEEAWELRETGPGGTDIILMYRRDRRGIQNVIVQTFATLPVQMRAFAEITYAYMSHGGIVMRDVGNNIIGYVTPPTI